MNLLAIDPGTTESAIVGWDGERITEKDTLPNHVVMDLLRDETFLVRFDRIVCERVECYGMAVGKEVFSTVYWSGRMMEAALTRGVPFALIGRRHVKLHLCQSPRAKDANIIQALKDKLGDKGTKKAPGVTFGISGHTWQALALAIVCMECPELLKEGAI